MLLSAFLCGSLLAWKQFRPVAESAAPEAHLSALERREQILREGMEQDLDPGTERSRLIRGVTNRMELAQIYLDQHRLDEANQLFANLAQQSASPKAVLGRLGNVVGAGL